MTTSYNGNFDLPGWALGGRPTPVGAGTFGFNKSSTNVEWWSGTQWLSPLLTPGIASIGVIPGQDITTVIQDIITSGTESVIFIPPGTYLIDPVNITRPITIFGSGQGVTILQPATTTGSSTHFTGLRIFNIQSDFVKITNMSLIGTIPANTTPLLNTIRDYADVNVYPNIWIDAQGLPSDTGYNHIIISDLYISGGIQGTNLTSGDDIRIINNTIEDMWDGGIGLGDAKTVYIAGNVVRNTRWNEGAMYLGTSATSVSGYNINVVGNQFINCGYLATQENVDINASSMHQVNFTGNLFQHDVLWTYYGHVATIASATVFSVPDNSQNSAFSWLNYGTRRVRAVGSSGAGTAIEGISRSSFSTTGDTHTNTTVDNLAFATTGLVVGMTVTGTNIPASTTIAAILGAASIQLSQAATGTTGGGTVTFATPYYSASANKTIVAVTWDSSNLLALSAPIFTYLDCKGGGIEIKADQGPSLIYDFCEQYLISSNVFKLAGTKHAITCTNRDAALAKARRILFVGNSVQYDALPVSGDYGAINSESWTEIIMLNNWFLNAFACFKCDANLGDNTSGLHVFQGNRVRNCRIGVYLHDDSMPDFHMRNNDMEVLDFGFWAGTSTSTHDRLVIQGNRIVQVPDSLSSGNNCVIYLANGSDISIDNNPELTGNRWPITIGQVGSGTLANVSVRGNKITTTSSSSSFSAVAIYRGDSFDLDNTAVVALAQRGWITPSGAPTNIRNTTLRGYSAGAPVILNTAGQLGDYFRETTPAAGGTIIWPCTTAGAANATVWKGVAIQP